MISDTATAPALAALYIHFSRIERGGNQQNFLGALRSNIAVGTGEDVADVVHPQHTAGARDGTAFGNAAVDLRDRHLLRFFRHKVFQPLFS